MRSEKDNQDIPQQLARWKLEIGLPPSFQADVWARIAAEEAQAKASRSLWKRLGARMPWPQWREELAAAVIRPLPAAALAVLLVGFSVGMGLFHAQAVNASSERLMAVHYLESINPLALQRSP